MKKEVEPNQAATDTGLNIDGVRCSYLVKFVNPSQEYPVTYTIKQDGTKVNEPTMLKGEDLTEPQIVELFVKELL